MEEYEEKLLEAIDKDVRSNADLVEEKINEETNALREDQIGFFKEGLKKDTETYLEGELQDLRVSAATKTSRDRLDVKKKLLTLRQSLVNDLENSVKEELKKFTKTDGYAEYLKKNIAKADVSSDGYFSVRENDAELMNKILKEMGLHNEVKKDFFPIGGFRYVDEKNRVEYSCLLSERLKEQSEWFRDNSNFRIMEREEDA